MNNLIPFTPRTFTLDEMVTEWLHDKVNVSHSQRTQLLYQRCISQFRAVLQQSGLDLDSPDEAAISVWAQGFAAYSSKGIDIAPATYNLRLSIISSFYLYAIKHRWIASNPIDMTSRRKKTETANAATYLEPETVKAALAKIDRYSAMGARDYALLTILLSTGRRVSEVASMKCGDIDISNFKVTLTFPRCKGGKVMRDVLDFEVAQVLVDYVQSVYSDGWRDDAPVWVSYSRRNPGKGITSQTIADICARVLGISKVHATRHTFAILMEDSGAKITDIQARLGHSNPATTGIYMQRLRNAENAFSGKIAQRLGIRGR